MGFGFRELAGLILVVVTGCDGQTTQPGEFGGAGGVPAVGCGNGVAEGTEQCDGLDLRDETCLSATMRSKPSGVLRCQSTCTLDTSGCGAETGGSAGAGGGTSDPACLSEVPSFDTTCAECACSACTRAMQECSADPGCVALRNCAYKARCAPNCFYVPGAPPEAAPCWNVLNEYGGIGPSAYLVLPVLDCASASSCDCFDKLVCKCDGDTKISCEDGTARSCAPYRCTAVAECVTSCASDGDCAFGARCGTDRVCR